MSSSSSGLQSISVISPELVVAVTAITELLPSVGERIVHNESVQSAYILFELFTAIGTTVCNKYFALSSNHK